MSDTGFAPGYIRLLEAGALGERVEQARQALHDCRLCGWTCGIDRSQEVGPCRTGMRAAVATAYVHFGEEKPLIAGGGSGAVFFSNCDLRCQFCQTYRWNVKGHGQPLSARQLADVMLDLQARGAANINLVTPTHVTSQALEAVYVAALDGLRLPLVWNSGGYDSPEALALLDGVVDIYMPDMKYSDADLGRRLSAAYDYPTVNREAILLMHRQVGDLILDAEGRARRGLLVRHLVMPGHAANTAGVLRWLAANLGPDTYLSLMDQYRPAYRAPARAGLDRPLAPAEYAQARRLAVDLGLTRLDESTLRDLSDEREIPDDRSILRGAGVSAG
jgi:putative pyruvate formate lyase activating enzyme